MSLEDKIQQAVDQLSLAYKQLNILQADLISQIEQEEETIAKLEQEDLKKISFTLNRLPEYKQRLRDITAAMASIEKRVQKLKKRAIHVEEKVQAGN